MKIQSVTIRGFQCFNEIGETIKLDNLTCYVGPNASGKTAAMVALTRLFGESNIQRQVLPTDFHLKPGEEINAKSSRSLSVECRLTFIELENEDASTDAIPETFNQMIVDDVDGTPYCRIRLDATWTNDGTTTGDIDQSISWILTSSDDTNIIENGNRRRVQPGDRARVRVVYVPAMRDPYQQIRVTTATSFGRLLEALAWNGAENSIRKKLEELQGQLSSLPGVQTMNTHVQGAWNNFYDGRVARNVEFRALEEDPTTLIKQLEPYFRPGDDGRNMNSSTLSDGLRSLFSLSLSFGLFHVEELLRTTAVASGFGAEVKDKLPIHTIIAVEEPENHLSPQYLGRVVAKLEEIASGDRVQVILSSHSPSILGRVQPDNVRYFHGHEHTHATRVKVIPLPIDDADEAFKYVREAVRGFPELYFARLVILGEGASEQIVLRRLFEASGTPLDTHFISVVPLGGRHVNHFWRLLHGLGIPFLTLLDLDREKEGAGWGRVQYVRNQLVKLYEPGDEKVRFKDSVGNWHSLFDQTYDNLDQNPDIKTTEMDAWLNFFSVRFGIYFSSPLDLDFSMLEAFPVAYRILDPPQRGPSLPEQSTQDYNNAIDLRMKQVLASDSASAPATLGSTYTVAQQELFAWYKYLFVDRSKPVAHMRALLSIDDESLKSGAPETLRSLVERARMLVTSN